MEEYGKHISRIKQLPIWKGEYLNEAQEYLNEMMMTGWDLIHINSLSDAEGDPYLITVHRKWVKPDN